MAIAFANSGSGGINTSGTSDTVDITAAAVGDWVYCGIFNAANEASITFTGWTQLLSGDQGTTSHYSLWRRQKQSGDTTFSVSWPTSQKETWVWVSYSGLDGTTPDELAAEASASSATQTTPSLTPNAADRWSLCFFYVRSTTSAPLAFGSYTSPLVARVDALPQATSRWVRAAAADTASAVTQAAHQYSATSTNGSQGGAILLFLIPASGATPISGSDSATATDTSTLVPDASTTDTASASETASIAADVAVTEQASLSEAASVVQVQTVTASDAGSLGEQAGPIDLGATDQAALAESSQVSQQSTTPSAADAATLGEQAIITVTLAGADAASLAETLGALGLAVADAAALAEIPSLAVQTAGSDGAALADLANIRDLTEIFPGYGTVIPSDVASGTVQPAAHDTGRVLPADQATGSVQPSDHDKGGVQPTSQATGSVRLQ